MLLCHDLMLLRFLALLSVRFRGLFPSDNLRPFYQLRLFMLVDPATSFHPFLGRLPILVTNIIHFMSPSILGLLWDP